MTAMPAVVASSRASGERRYGLASFSGHGENGEPEAERGGCAGRGDVAGRKRFVGDSLSQLRTDSGFDGGEVAGYPQGPARGAGASVFL